MDARNTVEDAPAAEYGSAICAGGGSSGAERIAALIASMLGSDPGAGGAALDVRLQQAQLQHRQLAVGSERSPRAGSLTGA